MEWIEIQKQKPKNGQKVLIAIQDPMFAKYDIISAKFDQGLWIDLWQGTVMFDKTDEKEIYRPIYWAEMPNPPKQEQ